jgi:hypothetical protein
MELGRQSNLGTLVSAVLVGLLAISTNELVRVDRSALKDFFHGLRGRARAVRTVPPVDQGELKVEHTKQRIVQIETELAKAFEQWKEGNIKANDRRYDRLWQAIRDLHTLLETDAELRESLPTSAHVDYVWLLFRAAEMRPTDFSVMFLDECRALAAHRDEQVRRQAAVLSIYHGYDPRRPREDELNKKLEAFARANSDNMIGVFLYLLISRELYDLGQRDMAERILRNGIRIYQEFPGNIGRLKLLNELMDQRMNT